LLRFAQATGALGYEGVFPFGVVIMWRFVCRLAGNESAVTVIEYSLIIFLIGTAAIGAFTRVGHNVMNMLGPTAGALH
jgi:Flp pilus assembly pilin Flp